MRNRTFTPGSPEEHIPLSGGTLKQSIKKDCFLPKTENILLTSIFLSLIVISRGDPGILMTCGLVTIIVLYGDRIDQIFNAPKTLKLTVLSAFSMVGGLFLSTVYSPAYALFFDGYEEFLNNTLGQFLPGGQAIFGVAVNIARFIFVTYMIFKSIKAWNERTNDEDWIALMKVPAIIGFTLLILDFLLQLIIQ
jgi:hypothetical protein